MQAYARLEWDDRVWFLLFQRLNLVKLQHGLKKIIHPGCQIKAVHVLGPLCLFPKALERTVKLLGAHWKPCALKKSAMFQNTQVLQTEASWNKNRSFKNIEVVGEKISPKKMVFQNVQTTVCCSTVNFHKQPNVSKTQPTRLERYFFMVQFSQNHSVILVSNSTTLYLYWICTPKKNIYCKKNLSLTWLFLLEK